MFKDTWEKYQIENFKKTMNIKLIVIRTSDIEKLANFYTLLGFAFEYHKHGNGPFHYSTTIDKTVLEIYPLKKSQSVADENLRLGFEIDDFENTLEKLKTAAFIFNDAVLTDFGFMTVITDPDNRKIELYKKIE